MSAATTEGAAPFHDFLTWYQVVGDLESSTEGGPAPLILLHGGPGATHDYLSPLSALASDGRAVVFYDQLGNGRSTHLPSRGSEFWTVPLFVEELANLLRHLGISNRYHVLGQSWGGFLGQEHALTKAPGLLSLVLSNTAASYPAFAVEAERLRSELPADVQATLTRHETAGTTDDPEYASACEVFYHRHLCRLDPWPQGVSDGLAQIDADPTVYHTMNGPSEFHVTGSAREWSAEARLAEIAVPTLVLSGRFDEATPALQETLLQGITGSRQVIFERSSHMPFWEEPDAYLLVVAEWLLSHD
ncbi:MAG TPA: proline iminopeptidase-family hydrolase [Candidatus Dormibacteraeota bacterium]|nr:proline iminopeptidase-family hydrolase [Candidatus Dormibacteraeota bacterium]